MKDAIVVDRVSKEFRQYHLNRLWTLQEAMLRGLQRRPPVEPFWALRDVSFNVPTGRMFGVIGANGSGKSTLLRLLGGVMRPDSGSVKVNGRVGALLELGAGFHDDLTGRENVFVNGVIGGLTRREVAERFDSIVAFAELEKFIDSPLRTFSTGMQMRLAFAVAVHVEPEILLIDEVLSVGDLAFQRKCLDRITQFKVEGCSIVLVSHEVSVIRELCDEALWLRHGQIAEHGSADNVVNQYVAEMEEETRHRRREAKPRERPFSSPELLVNENATRPRAELTINKNRIGSLELEITAVRVLDKWNETVTELESGSPLRVEVDYLAAQPLVAPIFQVRIFREDGLVCYDLNTEGAGSLLDTVYGKGQITLDLERLDLNSGLYYVDVGAYVRDRSYAYDCHSNVHPLVIHGDDARAVLYSPHRWETLTSQSVEKTQESSERLTTCRLPPE